MKSRDPRIRAFAIIFVIYCALSLMDYASPNYGAFKDMYSGLSGGLIFFAWLFGIAYGVLGVLCGMRIMRHEDWARKTAIVMIALSLVLGIAIVPTALKNLEGIYLSQGGLSLGQAQLAVRITTLMVFLYIFFEILFIYFFSRADVKEHFREG